ncbi:MAG: GNAT family N-acetyltransferase [Lapillicoccus sp.]
MDHADLGTGFEQVAGPLRLRRPTAADADAYRVLNTDPRTYVHAPETMPDALGCRIGLDADIAHWREHGFGYLAVDETATGRLVGWCGLKARPDREALNLYYRLSHDRLGRGYGRLLARAVTVSATEWLTGRAVEASIRTTNPASLRTALSAGMVRVGTEGPPGAASDVLELPRVRAVAEVDAGLREQLLDLWVRVNDSGGAVGFPPGASRGDVEPVLDTHLAELRAGTAVLGVLHEPDGRVVGFGWWRPGPEPLYAHVATLWRLQVDPDRRGRNLGRLLLAGLHALARDLPGVELLRLDYRSGSGLGDFYARAGWVETGRQPAGLRLGPGDYRDDVAMMRRVDGGPLAGDGLT